MADPISLAENRYFMKGKSRHWFWPLLVALLIGFVSQFAFTAIIGFASESGSGTKEGYLMIDAVIQFLEFGSMAAVLLGYGLCNTVKAYKVLFVLLACFQLPAAAASYMSNLSTINSILGVSSQSSAVALKYLAQAALGILAPAAWIASLLVITFGRPATTVLRVSAVLLTLFILCNLIYDLFLRTYLLYTLNLQNVDFTAIGLIMAGVNAAIGLVYAALSAFFFGAISFSKRRTPVPSPVAIGAETQTRA